MRLSYQDTVYIVCITTKGADILSTREWMSAPFVASYQLPLSLITFLMGIKFTLF
ncbi:hypothetical protein SDC9_73222 [bioreactor metagenome]|uniref:Uncharacterized protein n=1 Tax=bioreactor metagenome TaxID=1076179 RepID=A0A644YES3_9ZZZZ